MGENCKVRAIITYFGEPQRIPKSGERVELRVASGCWQGGFRCLSEPLDEEAMRPSGNATLGTLECKAKGKGYPKEV